MRDVISWQAPPALIRSCGARAPRPPPLDHHQVTDSGTEGWEARHGQGRHRAAVWAIESLLVEKGLMQPATIAAIVEKYEIQIGPHNGAAVVARAWTNPAFKARLLVNAMAGIAELGFFGVQGEDMVENIPTVHNMVVYTLCSCYPWPTLSLPPNWYKSAPYRKVGHRSKRRARGIWRDAAARKRSPRVGQQRGIALIGAARTTTRRRGSG